MRIGVDLGGTKIEIVALAADGQERLRRRVPTPSERYEDTLEAVVSLVLSAERELGCRCSVGVGAPGSASPRTGLVRNANSRVLNGRALAGDLALQLARPVRVENDANCFAMSEATDGAGAGRGCVFGVILGTGVGGGLVIDGQVRTGANAIAGEWGHNRLPGAEPDQQWALDSEQPGPACYCGRHGCLETWLSGPGFAGDARRLALASGAQPMGDAFGVIDAMRAAVPWAVSAFDRYVDRLARGLAAVINMVDPDVIVLGGGLSNIDELYEQVPQRWQRYAFSDGVQTPLLRNHHGDSSGVRGAACLWPATHGTMPLD